MLVCLCHPFSDKKALQYLSSQENPSTVSKTYKACSGGEKPQCCACLETLKAMVKAHNGQAASA